MLVLKLKQAKLPAWRGYTSNTSGFLPKRMSWFEPEAADSLAQMMEACNSLVEFTDGYRSVAYQIECRKTDKRRLFAKPTKSGHNFGFSIDIKIEETLENFRASGRSDLVAAGRNRASLGRWLKRFGWTGIKKESWHFNYLNGHETTVQKIESLYGPVFLPENKDVQRALNKLLKPDEPLELDGVLGVKSNRVAVMADKVLNTNDHGSFSAWFRRVLIGATIEVKEV